MFFGSRTLRSCWAHFSPYIVCTIYIAVPAIVCGFFVLCYSVRHWTRCQQGLGWQSIGINRTLWLHANLLKFPSKILFGLIFHFRTFRLKVPLQFTVFMLSIAKLPKHKQTNTKHTEVVLPYQL
jgi:hypothetical protein